MYITEDLFHRNPHCKSGLHAWFLDTTD